MDRHGYRVANWYAGLVEGWSLGRSWAGGGTVDTEDSLSLCPVAPHASPLSGLLGRISPPSRAARSRRPLAPSSPRAARSRHPLAPPAPPALPELLSLPTSLSLYLRVSTVHHPTRKGWKGVYVLALRGATTSTPSGGTLPPPPSPSSLLFCRTHRHTGATPTHRHTGVTGCHGGTDGNA